MNIQVQNIVKRYRRTTAADHVSFELASGHVYGFVGPNGAGKTTTIKVMSTLLLPDEGDVLYDGVSVVNYPEKVRRFIGYMPDSLPAYRDIAVWEYIDFFARSFGLKGETRHRRLKEIEEFCSLQNMREKYIDGLSKGMKQRVSLARALVNDPDVMILDEPAAGLDPRARLDLKRLIKLLAAQGKTILLSSHILSELQDMCDAAIIIELGRVLACGTIQEIAGKLVATTPPPLPNSVAVQASPPKEEHTILEIHTLEAATAVKQRLLEDPTVLSVDLLDDSKLNVIMHGTEKDIAPVMARVFAAGLPVVGFSRKQLALEEIFMRVTKGDVQ
ncbi:MAG: ABC transporter ATP-binding protein [Victivallales bacterium]|nr:ABC transporter ATP-binding protein [Victivallales bacterium]